MGCRVSMVLCRRGRSWDESRGKEAELERGQSSGWALSSKTSWLQQLLWLGQCRMETLGRLNSWDAVAKKV